ncbi:hypothetical protein Gogos_022205, partial [Gossypium gossypioides]|nr:hypothetical protein [Gossypium gossypioides]
MFRIIVLLILVCINSML